MESGARLLQGQTRLPALLRRNLCGTVSRRARPPVSEFGFILMFQILNLKLLWKLTVRDLANLS